MSDERESVPRAGASRARRTGALATAASVWLLVAFVWRAQPAESTLFGKLAAKVGLAKRPAADLERQYTIIDEYLTRNLPAGGSLAQNLELADRMLRETSSGRLRAALKRLLGLRELLGDDAADAADAAERLCGPTSGAILDANEEATGGAVERVRRLGAGGVSRVDWLVHQVAERHIASCPALLANRFQRRERELPDSVRAAIESLRDRVLGEDLMGVELARRQRTERDGVTALAKYILRETTDAKVMRSIYDTLLRMSSRADDPDGAHLRALDERKRAHRAGLSRLFGRHLVGPCARYVHHFRDVFPALEFDFDYMEPLIAFPATSERNVKLLFGFMNYRACGRVVRERGALFEHFYEWADWRLREPEEAAAAAS